MSSLINLLLSLIMGIFFGHESENSSTAQNEDWKPRTEILLHLEEQQQLLEC
ncbi:hypothetical protein [Christiangramia flava]|nr:hypothetical protein [Christiangramia flava]